MGNEWDEWDKGVPWSQGSQGKMWALPGRRGGSGHEGVLVIVRFLPHCWPLETPALLRWPLLAPVLRL